MSEQWPVDSGNSEVSPVTQEPQKKNKTLLIVIIVVALLILLCCCIGALVWLWNNGDQLIQEMSGLLTTAVMLL